VNRLNSVRAFQRHLVRLCNMARTLLALTGTCLFVSGCGGFYSAEEITATVVDAETKAPLAGVHVIAEWAIRGGMNYGDVVGYMKVMETVTDKNGRFHFPGWGPRPNLHFGEIRQAAPALMLFKSGYRYISMENNGNSMDAAPHATRSDWNHQTITMKPHLWTLRDEAYAPLVTDVESLWRHGEWHRIHRFLCALAPEHDSTPEQLLFKTAYSTRALRQRGIDCDLAEDNR
jgi:hypothetical protein